MARFVQGWNKESRLEATCPTTANLATAAMTKDTSMTLTPPL